MPGMYPTDAMLYDFNGVSKTITINGKLSNSGVNRLSVGSAITIDEQRKWIEKLVNGSQTGVIFLSDYTGSYDGVAWEASSTMIAGLEWNEVSGDPSSLPFKIVFYVGSI